ncbi:MAG: hypothetical protein HEP71_06145 [Roseivirga sp.]|nr:hypothetical protein [Roseivirga sp.]
MINLTRGLTALTLLVIGSVSNAQDSTAYIDSKEIIQKGIGLHDEEDFDRALSYYQMVSPSDSNYAWSLYEQVLTLTSQEKFSDAIELANEGLGLQSHYKASFYDQLGTAHDYNDETEKALEFYKTGLEKYPYHKPLLYNYGVTLKKTGNYAEAQNYFIRRLELDPFHAGSHYQLAELSMLQGFRTKAMLSYLMYLAIRPGDLQTLSRVEKLLVDALEEEGSIAPYSSNGFEELDAFIRSRFATKKAFRPSINIDYLLTRHAEVIIKQLKTDEQSKDFWVQLYLPFFNGLKNKKILPSLLYSIMSGTKKDEINTWLTKNKKKIEQFQTLARETILASRLYHQATVAGQENYYRFWYYDIGTLNAIGNSNEEGVDIGPYVYYHPNGELSAVGVLDMKGNKTGKWVYYRADGSVSSEESYDAEGNLQGEMISYHATGGMASRVRYENGMANGPVEVFFGCGKPSEVYAAVNDQVQGKGTVYDVFGNVLADYTMDQSNLNGPYLAFHSNGKKAGEYNYLKGQLHGSYISYHKNGQIREKGLYKKGELDGAWTGFFESGSKEYELTYNNGKLVGTTTYYHETGEKASVATYLDGKANGDYLGYDEDGVLFNKYTYEEDLLKSYQHYDKGGKVLSEGASEDTMQVTAYNPHGHIMSLVTHVKGTPDGPQTYYYPNGNVHYTINIVDGSWHGTYNEYYKSGELKIKTEYENGQNNGWHREYYRSGQSSTQAMAIDGNLEQRYTAYYRDGTRKEENFYRNGQLHGLVMYYSPEGKVFSMEKYHENVPVFITYYDSTGNVTSTSELPNGTGNILQKRTNGVVTKKREWLCGKENSDYMSNYDKDLPDQHISIKNGEFHGKTLTYHSNGQLSGEGYYKNNELDSLWTWYDPLGNMIGKSWYKNGELHGKNIDIYPNGQVESECSYVNGERHGVCKYYAEDGSLQYQKTYHKDFGIVGYQYELPGGKMGDLIPIDVQNTLKVEAFFPNKEKSISQKYVKGQLDGPSIFYHPNGQVQDEFFYKNGTEEGWTRSYYKNGQLRRETFYADGAEEGLSRRFREDGTLQHTIQYKEGLKHGYETWYKPDGSVAKKLLFWNNVIY